MTPLLIAVFVASALFAALGLILIAVMANKSAAEVRLAEVTTSRDVPLRTKIGFRSILPHANRLLRPIRQLFGLSGDDTLAYRLSIAGYRAPHHADAFLDAKLLCPIIGVLIATFADRSNLLPFSLVLGAAGFFAPDLFLMWAVQKRKRAITRGLPDAIDLMVICMEAGLGMDQAVLRVAQEFQTVSAELSDEMLILCREQRAGKPRVEAWQTMADRVDLDSIRYFSSMLAQSERLGTPIARALSQFADSLRTKRLMSAEEQAAKTPVKLLFPLVLFIFPAMFIVILGPAGIALAKAFEFAPTK
jgi:tight adherence protein C